MRIISNFKPWDTNDPTGNFGVIHLQDVLNNIVSTQPDKTSVLRPDLAEQWSISPDGKTWEFRLRKGVQWHDGQQFTSRDVTYALERARNPAEGTGTHKGRLAVVDRIETPDDSTVRVVLSRASATISAALSVPSLLVYPAHVPDVRGKWSEKPIGTGAFLFKAFTPSVSIEYVKNPQYFKKDAAGRTLPYLDSATYFIIVDQQIMLGAFYSGRLSCLCGFTSDLLIGNIDLVKKQVPDARLAVVKGVVTAAMTFSGKPPLDNQKVRQAIHTGIDRKAVNAGWQLGLGYYPPGLLVSSAAGGQWQLPDGQVLKIPGFREPKDQDRALAKQMMRDAGFDPSTVSVRVLGLTKFADIGTLLDAELVALGFKRTTLNLTGDSASQARDRTGLNFDIYLDEYGPSIDDPSESLFPRTLTGGPQNYAKWSYPELDTLAQQQDAELDAAKRRALLYDFQRKVYDLAFTEPLVHQSIAYATHSWVEGFALNRTFAPSSALRLEEVWLNK